MKPQITQVFLLLLTLLAVALPGMRAHASGTAAGTNINNQASVDYLDLNGISQTNLSNMVVLRVDERLDVTVTRNDASDIPVLTNATSQPLSFHVTNNGNGSETFRLNANSALLNDQFDPVAVQIAYDTNSNGIYDPTSDVLYVPGQNDLLLQADQSATVFVLGDMPSSLTNGDRSQVALNATAITGSGPPGTVFAGQGTNGGDAVTGSTTAQANDKSSYVAQLVTIQFIKTQKVTDPSGGSTPVPGAIVTYTLVAQLAGTGQLSAARVDDPIPAQTTYVAGTLTLNGDAISDAADGDAGEANNTMIALALGTLSAPATRTITFQVKLN
jgi:uncharacterized repeat protein (TIGR01451 family)